MSLYQEAAQVLDIARQNSGSFKSIVFGRKDWKSNPKTLYALTTEATKWSEILSEVLENSQVLKIEKQLNPALALLLAHDLLLSKKGVALPQSHGLALAITRYKARLAAELTKARLRRGFATQDALRDHVRSQSNTSNEGENGLRQHHYSHPRWIRINTLRTSLDEQMNSTFAGYQKTQAIDDITHVNGSEKLIYIDENVSNLIAIPAKIEITSEKSYRQGKFILQDKASCFPAYLLDPGSRDGDIMDACAAPGNKTTHLAALIKSPIDPSTSRGRARKVIACERDVKRSETLANMVEVAGAGDTVLIKAKQDFLKLDPTDKKFSSVTSVLLDPSCSGTGIVGRDEVKVNVHLPGIDKKEEMVVRTNKQRKRKRKTHDNSVPELFTAGVDATGAIVEEAPTESGCSTKQIKDRLSALFKFQLQIVKHAIAFPAARRITYSTCSVYSEENEHVVVKALLSDIAVKRGWRIMRREEQVDGLKKWHMRGDLEAVMKVAGESESSAQGLDAEEIADACIRCCKGGKDGTMGFFLAGFVRDSDLASNDNGVETNSSNSIRMEDEVDEYTDEWNGFSDNET